MKIDKLPVRPEIENAGQPYWDKPIHATHRPLPIAQSIRRGLNPPASSGAVFETITAGDRLPELEPIVGDIVAYEHYRLRRVRIEGGKVLPVKE